MLNATKIKSITKYNHNGLAFTLIELLVVIAVIGLLSTIAVAALNSSRAKARDARRLSDLRQIERAMQLYYDANNGYPSVSGHRALGIGDSESSWGNCNTAGSDSLINDLAPYLPSIPLDPSTTRDENTYIYGRGSYAVGCIANYIHGYFLIWRPDKGNPANDGDCLGMGIRGCCGGASPCACSYGYSCAYQIGEQDW